MHSGVSKKQFSASMVTYFKFIILNMFSYIVSIKQLHRDKYNNYETTVTVFLR